MGQNTTVEERSGPSHAFRVACFADECTDENGKAKHYTVFAVKKVPGVLEVGRLYCEKCHREMTNLGWIK